MKYLLAFLLLAIGTPAFAYEYSRTPDFNEIEAVDGSADVDIFIAMDDENDPLWSDWQTNDPAVASWRVWIQDQLGSEDKYFGECKEYPADPSDGQTFTLPIGEYSVVSLRGYESNDCTGAMIAGAFPEYADGETIFAVIAGDSGPVFDFMGSTTPADIFNSVKDGVQETGSSAWPLFTIMGVPLTFWIGRAVIGIIKVV